MRTPWITAAAMAASMLSSGLAIAQTWQPWLSDPGVGGIGIRAGNLELHPGIAGELGYDSNFFQSSGSDPANNVTEPVVPSLVFRVTPSLTLKSLGDRRKLQDGTLAAPPKIDFRSSLSARLGTLYSLDRDLADPVDRFTLGADLGANLDILPERPWGAGLTVGLSRLEQPNSDPGNVVNAFDRTGVKGGFDIKWRPGGGLLEWSLGYAAQLTLFDQTALRLNRLEHGVSTRGRWKFLPRTALLYEGHVGFLNHTQDGTRQRDAQPISSQIGVNGLITGRLGLLLFGGWKGMFYEADSGGGVDDFDGPIGRAELTWYLNSGERVGASGAAVHVSTWRLGYQHDAANSGISNFYTVDRVYTDFTHVIGRALRISLRGGVSFVGHGTPRASDGRPLTVGGDLNEWRPDGSLFAEYELLDTVSIFSNTGFSASPADNFLQIPGAASGSSPPQDNLKYFRFTTFLGARWFM